MIIRPDELKYAVMAPLCAHPLRAMFFDHAEAFAYVERHVPMSGVVYELDLQFGNWYEYNAERVKE